MFPRCKLTMSLLTPERIVGGQQLPCQSPPCSNACSFFDGIRNVGSNPVSLSHTDNRSNRCFGIGKVADLYTLGDLDESGNKSLVRCLPSTMILLDAIQA